MKNAQPAEKAPGFPAAARMIVSGRGERRRRPRVFPPKVCFLSVGWRRDAACAAVSPCTQRNSFSPLPLFVRPTDAPCPGRGEGDPAQDSGTSPPHGNGIPAGEPCGKTGGVKSAGYRKSRVPGGWPGAGAVLRRGRSPQGKVARHGVAGAAGRRPRHGRQEGKRWKKPGRDDTRRPRSWERFPTCSPTCWRASLRLPLPLAWKRRLEMRVPRRGNFLPGPKAGATPR